VSTVSCCFVPGTAKGKAWSPRPQVAFADAVMVGLSGHLDAAEKLWLALIKIIKKHSDYFETNVPGTFTGQKNTKKDVQQRIDLFDKMLTQVLHSHMFSSFTTRLRVEIETIKLVLDAHDALRAWSTRRNQLSS